MTHFTDIPIIILAAGASKRMRGRDKLMEVVDGQPLIRRQADMARTVTSGAVIVTLPPPPHSRYAPLENRDVQLEPILHASKGLSESLKGGLAALPTDTKAAMLLLADLPELTAEDLITVASGVEADADHLIWRATTEDGAPGHPIVVSSRLFEDLKNTHGDAGGGEVIKRNHTQTKFVALPGQRALCDLDTPEDWAAWRKAKKYKKQI